MIVLTVSLINKLFVEKPQNVATLPEQKVIEEQGQEQHFGKSARELRALWMSRFDYTRNLDTYSPHKIKAYISTTFQKMAEANFNTVFFQIRGSGDAYYKSKYEPWGELLTGKLGKNPGWDPLRFAIKEAHHFGLDLHAWVNVFPAWRGNVQPDSTQPVHPLLENPSWLAYGSSGKPMQLNSHYVAFSPGNPEVQNYLLEVLEDIVKNYDVDGIHFDYIRYPNGACSKDPVSLARFKSDTSNPLELDWEDWQREQVTAFVSRAYNLLTKKDPILIMSAAVIGSYNKRRWSGYNKVYQDAKRWLELGKIDMIVPMLYFNRNGNSNGYQAALEEWTNSRQGERKIVAGLGVFTINWQDILRQIDDYREAGLDGCCLFAASSLTDTNFQSLQQTKFRFPAKKPYFSWKNTNAPPEPDSLNMKFDTNRVVLSWTIPDKDSISVDNFVIYKIKGNVWHPDNPRSIVDIIPGDARRYILDKCKESDDSFYISALNPVGAESQAVMFTPRSSSLPAK